MTVRWRMLVVLLALLPANAFAQPAVFFDDFNGDSLQPHWNTPSRSAWEYNLSNSMLNVTGLFSPSHPKSPSNFAGMYSLFTPQSDFRVDVWMGWDAGQQPHRLGIQVGGPFGGNPIIASMGYRYESWAGPNPQIFAATGTTGVNMPAPAPGMHQFTIVRTGTQIAFYLDGSTFANLTGASALQATTIGFEFLGPFPGELGAFHINRVEVVPSPGILLSLCACLLTIRSRRRD